LTSSTPAPHARPAPPPTPPGRRRGASRWLPPVVAILLLAAVGFLIWYFLFRSEDGASSHPDQGNAVSLNPATLDFGDEDLGKRSAAQTVTLANGSADPLGIAEIAIEGENARDFVLTKATACATQAPLNEDESCALVVRFRPRARGSRAAELLLSFDGDRGSGTVTLRGRGVGEPAVVAETTRLDFGDVELEAKPETRRVALTNVGNAPLRIEEISIEGAAQANYKVGGSEKPCETGKRVKARATCTISVRFAPSKLGRRQATLVIVHDAEGSPTEVELRGIGTGEPKLEAGPDPLTFPRTQIDVAGKAKTVTVTNAGTDVLHISSIALGGGDVDDFEVVSGGSCSRGAELEPSGSCTVSVRFIPTRSGARQATLVIGNNTTDGPYSVALEGTGARPKVVQAQTAAETGTEAGA
jgi:Cep192 domain 4